MSPQPQEGAPLGGAAGGMPPRPSYWKRLEVWLCFFLLLAFILPWLQLGPLSTGSGLQLAGLPFLLDSFLGGFAAQGAQAAEVSGLWVLHLLYVLPLAAIATLILAAMRKSWRATALIAGLVPWLALIYALTFDLEAMAQQTGQQVPPDGLNLFSLLGVGAYLSLLAGLLVVLRALGLLGRR